MPRARKEGFGLLNPKPASVGIEEVEKRIRELKAEIAPTCREIEALESAARVLRRLATGKPVTGSAPQDFTELTIPGAAKCLLRECAPEPMHYKEIARQAFDRGFKGKRLGPNATASSAAESFRRMMGQQPTKFVPVGKGKGLYRLADKFVKDDE